MLEKIIFSKREKPGLCFRIIAKIFTGYNELKIEVKSLKVWRSIASLNIKDRRS